jgi:large subunit ribosomal protein L15
MQLNELGPSKGSNKTGKRKGRGNGSGNGKTSGRGQKGAGARKSSNKGRVALEGGNFPLWRSVPKRGFSSPKKDLTQIVNLKKIETLSETEVTIEVMAANGLIKTTKHPVKILAYGALSKQVTVHANTFSVKAKAAIEAAGGKAETV